MESAQAVQRVLLVAAHPDDPEFGAGGTVGAWVREGAEFINHPDHRAVGTATLDAIYPAARDRLQFPEHLADGLKPHKVREVYLWGTQAPNVWVDIDQSFDLKIQALSKHLSQIPRPDGLVDRMRERARAIGEPQGLALAESFRRIVMAR